MEEKAAKVLSTAKLHNTHTMIEVDKEGLLAAVVLGPLFPRALQMYPRARLPEAHVELVCVRLCLRARLFVLARASVCACARVCLCVCARLFVGYATDWHGSILEGSGYEGKQTERAYVHAFSTLYSCLSICPCQSPFFFDKPAPLSPATRQIKATACLTSVCSASDPPAGIIVSSVASRIRWIASKKGANMLNRFQVSNKEQYSANHKPGGTVRRQRQPSAVTAPVQRLCGPQPLRSPPAESQVCCPWQSA